MWNTFISERMPTDFFLFFYIKGFFYMYGNSDYMPIFKSYSFKTKNFVINWRERKVALLPMPILHFSPKYLYGLGVYGSSNLGGKMHYLLFTLLIVL